MKLRNVTFPDEVLRRLERTKTLVDAIRIATEAAGSHDKLAAMLGTSRQTIIGWQNGTFPKPGYRDKLIAVGVPARLLVTADKTALERRLRRVEAEVAAIRKELG